VSRKWKQPQHDAVLTVPALRGRIQNSLREERFQHGLDLARALVKRDPSEPSQELLRKAILGRARQLRHQGKLRDAGILLATARPDGGPAVVTELATELAACGEIGRALALAQGLTEPALQARIVTQAADAAVVQGAAARTLLPEALQAQYDLVQRAFTLVQNGQDEPAREALQGIGLQSPFLEWKLLLRGLIAYYQNDDLRAIENWQRLSAERWPARLAAPLRLLIDKDFRAVQSHATQALLQKQADRLQGSGLVPLLRTLRAAIGNERQLPSAFRQAETLLGALRQQAPELVPRLAACFYWAIVHHGHPEDVQRYQRAFDHPADDPELHRLQALALEHRGMFEEAHALWQAVEKAIAANPSAWPGEQANRARALVWAHMGHNAEEAPESEEEEFDLPPFMRAPRGKTATLQPSAEQCYQHSIELAPDQIEGYQALLRHHLKQKKTARAEKAARQLLKRFPHHAATLETLADLRMQAQDYGDAIHYLGQALQGNPLERRLREKLATAHLFHARARAEEGKFDEARAEYQAALVPGGDNYGVLCKWAACEFKAGDAPHAEELLQQALAQKGNHLAVAFSMLIETIRLKLPAALKKRFDQQVSRELAEPPTAAAAVALADTVAAHRGAGVSYHGQKTHEKKVLTYLERARELAFTELQLVEVCRALHVLERPRLLHEYARLGQLQHPTSPAFFLIEARHNLDLGPFRCPIGQTTELLTRARELALAMPRNERRERVLEQLKDLEEDLAALNPFGGLFSPMGFYPFGDADDDEDAYDDDF
jgi:tetratricopeptide (TPR) repeat protein